MQISIIIPIFNEAATIDSLLTHLAKVSTPANIAEIIVVDGGSTDNSVSIVSEKFPEIRIICSEKGKSRQMNTASRHAIGEILYFLHVDSYPPNHFDQEIINAISKNQKAGCFRMKFDSKHWWLYLASWFTRFNSLACRGGDQSLFITKSLFDQVGGYDESFIIYEDNNFIKKLYAINAFTVLQKQIITSARLYKTHGVWKLQYHFFMIHYKNWRGASPEELYDYYKTHIS